jgi:hypothetical protein
MTRPSWPRRVALATLAAITIGAPSSLAGAVTAQARGPVEIDLYRPGDFVSQTNLVQCVGASIQMMRNIGPGANDRSAATQRRYWALARKLSPPRPAFRPKRRGASVHGWSAALNRLEVDTYSVIGYPTLREATLAAAKAIPRTGKPVGLLVWGGRHAWVMSGFRATADPSTSDSARVTHVDVLDPLYPRHSLAWGRSPKPGERISVATLATYFVPRRSTWSGPLSNHWVIVVPTDLEPRPGML